jgi:spermidine/putrescine transport system permease protein
VSSAVGRLGRFGLSSYFTLLVLFLYAPLVVLVVFAFEDSYIQALPWAGFTTKWFHTAFANTDLTSALRRSAMIGILDGLAATALGTMAAVALARRHLFLRPLWTTLLLLPLVVPYIVLAVGLVILLHQLGITTSLTAVLAGHIVISLPYSVLVILPRLRLLDASINEAARDLAASELWAFVLVTLPLLAPALASSFLIAFTISFDEFAIASFLAPAGAPTFPVFVYTGARTPLLQPEVIAVGSIVVVASLVLVVGAELVRRFWEGRLEGRKGETAPAFAVGA